MTLDEAFANLSALGEVRDAYTTGTPANVALTASANALAAALTAGAATADAAVDAADLTNPAGVLAAVEAAADAAGYRAGLAELAGLQRVLGRA